MKENTQVKFSIITPVYNSIHFLDRCVESVVHQTFTNWELILVDDGSTDSSFERCQEWSTEDSRISCFHVEHGGQGRARNRALEKAIGEYVLFLDADDWWELNCLEECNRIIENEHVDIVNFDLKVWGQNEQINIPRRMVMTDKLINVVECEPILSRNPCMVNKAYRRELFLQYNIKFFEHPYEDEIVGLLLHCYARRIWKLPNVFYNYDQRNTNSTTHEEENLRWFITQFEEIYQEFVTRKLFDTYKQTLGKLMLLLAKAEIERRSSQKILQDEISQKCFAILNHYNPKVAQVSQKKLLVYGSYNLRGTANCLAMDIHSVKHWQFSSLIVAMNHKKMNCTFSHTNPFRSNMVNSELNHEFYELIISGQLKQYDALLIDFLEERYDILRICDDYITDSDALEEGNLAGYEEGRIKLAALSSARIQLWKQKCDEFIELLQEHYSADKVILVKTYLMEGYGAYAEEQKFTNLEWIRQMNRCLEGYYDYFEAHFPGITVLDMKGEKENFSDISFKHGCEPWHTNEAWFYTLSDKLYAKLEERK